MTHVFLQAIHDTVRSLLCPMAPLSSMEAGLDEVNPEAHPVHESFKLHSKAATIQCSSTLYGDVSSGIP